MSGAPNFGNGFVKTKQYAGQRGPTGMLLMKFVEHGEFFLRGKSCENTAKGSSNCAGHVAGGSRKVFPKRVGNF
jgi:hypothetical protein